MALTNKYRVYLNGDLVRIVGVTDNVDTTAPQGQYELQPYQGLSTASQIKQVLPPYQVLVAANNQNFLDELGNPYSPTGNYTILQTGLQPILDPAPSGGGDATAANQVLEIAQLTQINSNTNPNNKPYLDRVVNGEIANSFLVPKTGINTDVDTGSTPEDVWSGGGAYTGFPAAAAEGQIVSSSAADVGTLTITYLQSPTSTAYVTQTFNVTGTTAVNLGVNIWRCHQATYQSNTNPTTTFNTGVITLRHRLAPTVVFLTVQPQTNASNEAVFTVPLGSKAIIKRVDWAAYAPAALLSTPACTARGALFVRPFGSSPKIVSEGLVSFPSQFQENLNGGVLIPPQTDIAARVRAVTADNSILTCAFDILVFPQ